MGSGGVVPLFVEVRLHLASNSLHDSALDFIPMPAIAVRYGSVGDHKQGARGEYKAVQLETGGQE